jgi:hypothetical protein
VLLFGRTAKRTCQDNRAAIPVKNPMSRNEVATARANIVAAMPRELHPIDVLADFLGSGDFPVEIADPDAAAKLILERLNDAVQDRAGCAGGPDMIEISQEAQIALAELSKRKARERLHRDGASSIPAMQRRIKALAPKGLSRQPKLLS